MTRLGYQIPNFTLPPSAGPSIVRNVIEQAKAAEAAGFDRVFVMDHFYQLPGLGTPDEPMMECYALLSALAQHTSKVRLSALVTGISPLSGNAFQVRDLASSCQSPAPPPWRWLLIRLQRGPGWARTAESSSSGGGSRLYRQ